MNKKLSDRFKQLIGESTAKDKSPLLSSKNVTNEKLADRLSEMEENKYESDLQEKLQLKELEEGWDESPMYDDYYNEEGDEKDLFFHKNLLPSEVEDIVIKYEDLSAEKDGLSTEDLNDFEEELKPHGYTFDWGLDYVPYDLHKIDK